MSGPSDLVDPSNLAGPSDLADLADLATPPVTGDRLAAALQRHFGFDDFRPGQRKIVETVLAGRSTVAILPTGGGKSLCYQLPALLREGVTIVVSPLIALMQDQVDQLHARGILHATALNSSLSRAEIEQRFQQLAEQRLKLLYVAPERFAAPGFIDRLKRVSVSLFVVDEAHCVSHWGHDFRPDYLHLRSAIASIQPKVVLALTATATPAVRREIAVQLGLIDPFLLVNSFDRPNLFFSVVPCTTKAKPETLVALLQGMSGSCIVYVARQRDAEELAALLNQHEVKTVPYHAGLGAHIRRTNQQAFLQGKVRVIVATVAFGMGIDKPDVRAVIHYQHPGSLEAYYQEAGRAGRDGELAQCLLLYDKRDSGLQRFFIQQRYPTGGEIREIYRLLRTGLSAREIPGRIPELSEEKVNVALTVLQDKGYIERTGQKAQTVQLRTDKSPQDLRLDFSFLKQRQQADYRRLGEMLDYLTTTACRRAAILRYFGERVPVRQNCGQCDLCTQGTPTAQTLPAIPGALDSQDVILGAVRDLQKRKMGRSGIAQVLAGSRSRKMKQLRLEESPHYGKLTRLTQDQIVEQIDSLIQTGQLRLIPGQYPSVVLASPAAQKKAEQTTAQGANTDNTEPVESRTQGESSKEAPEQHTSSTPQPQPPVPTLQSPFNPVPTAVGWAILRVVQSQDGELARAGVAHFLRGTTEMGARPTANTTTLPGYRFLVQYPHQELLTAIDLFIERKLLVVEATEQLSVWLTQRGQAALTAVKAPG